MNRVSHERIASIIHNQHLASAICKSVSSAMGSPSVHLADGNTVWDIFKHSLDAAIRDIEEHPRGRLFQRLIKYGPHNPDIPETLTSDGRTTLSDPECGACVEFIFSHMINRFKGELAELLALGPCVELVKKLQQEGSLPPDVQIYWGDVIQERRRVKKTVKGGNAQWGGFVKGADGLIVEQRPAQRKKSCDTLVVHGIVEVKSMALSRAKVMGQINRHISRLRGGVKLRKREWSPDNIDLPCSLRIIVFPPTWKLSREWHNVERDGCRYISLPEPTKPPVQTQTQELEPNTWRIKLAWSREAIEQAAYEMTFWYMSQVGKSVYTAENLPEGWKHMTPDEAGYNAIKMMLYFLMLRYISQRQGRIATKLYNVYCFGYPLGVDSREMLWPEDFPEGNSHK